MLPNPSLREPPDGNPSELVVLLFFIFLISAGVIWIHTSTVRDTYQYVQQERELRKLQQEIQGARVHWLKLTSPKRLEAMARTLGLKPPGMHQLLRYEPEKRLAIP